LRLARDKITGKSKGFAFLAYEDQRSTILAVDNFNGAEICGRTLRVDHVKKYKPPKEFMEVSEGFNTEDYRPTGPDGRGWGKFRNKTEEEGRLL
jgi:RNA-binding motif protein, X-linked 2